MDNDNNATLPIEDHDSRYLWRASFFGDLIKRNPGDAYPCVLAAGAEQASSTQNQQYLNSNSQMLDLAGSKPRGMAIARDMYGSVGKTNPYGQCSAWRDISQSGVGPLTYPSPVDNSLVVIPNGIYVMETSQAIRGNLPGYWATPQKVKDTIKQSTVFENFPGADGRSFISVHGQYQIDGTYPSTSYDTLGFIDITGPWR